MGDRPRDAGNRASQRLAGRPAQRRAYDGDGRHPRVLGDGDPAGGVHLGSAVVDSRSRHAAPRRRHGAGHHAARPPGPRRLHDLHGTAHRGPAGADVALAGQGDRLDRRSAVLRTPGRRYGAHRRRGADQPARGPARARRQHAHPAAGAPGVSDAGQVLRPQVQGNHRRRRARGRVLERRDPRAVLEQGLLRRRPARGRSGCAGIFRKACVRSHAGRSRAHRGPGEVALVVRADGEPEARRHPARPGAADDGRQAASSPPPRPTRPRRSPCASRARWAATTRTARGSRRRCGGNSSRASAWTACTRAG